MHGLTLPAAQTLPAAHGMDAGVPVAQDLSLLPKHRWVSPKLASRQSFQCLLNFTE